MAQSPAADVDSYLAAITGERAPALARLRELCRTELTGFTESIAYGMPVYARDRDGTAEIAFASQKQYISFYLMRSDVAEAFADRLAGQDMGKSCLRFRRPAAIDYDLIRDLLAAVARTPGPVC
ncbi:iron chaperone [Streptomyces sp. NPDC056144]|uniref:iron chaperone n=1 Tax=unclassified Streptomyces TaxID=2593676 RepID=UPI0035DB51A5